MAEEEKKKQEPVSIEDPSAAASGADAQATLGDTEAGEESGGASKLKSKERTKTSSAFVEAMDTPRGKAFTTIVITTLVVVLLFFLAITPAVSSIRRQLDINSQLEDRIQKMEAKLQSLLQLTNKEQTRAADLELFATLLGEKKQQEDIYSELADLVTRNKMEFKAITFDPEKISDPKYQDISLSAKIRYQTVKLSAVGSPDQAQTLVADVEESKRIFDIRDIVFTVPEDAEEGDTDVQIELNMNTIYWQKSD